MVSDPESIIVLVLGFHVALGLLLAVLSMLEDGLFAAPTGDAVVAAPTAQTTEPALSQAPTAQVVLRR